MTASDLVPASDVVVMMTPDEARRLTNEAKLEAVTFAEHLLTLYERGAHEALGYDAWKDYVSYEFAVGLADASRRLSEARVRRALRIQNLDMPQPSVHVAGTVLSGLLPDLNRPKDAPTDWTADDEDTQAAVVDAWTLAVNNNGGKPPSAKETKRTLVHAGVLADTRGGSGGTVSWLESLGTVGDDLIRAQKDMVKFEALLGEKEPTDRVVENAGRYAEMAEDLARRLRAVEAV